MESVLILLGGTRGPKKNWNSNLIDSIDTIDIETHGKGFFLFLHTIFKRAESD